MVPRQPLNDEQRRLLKITARMPLSSAANLASVMETTEDRARGMLNRLRSGGWLGSVMRGMTERRQLRFFLTSRAVDLLYVTDHQHPSPREEARATGLAAFHPQGELPADFRERFALDHDHPIHLESHAGSPFNLSGPIEGGRDRGGPEIAMAEDLGEPESSAEDRTDRADQPVVPARTAAQRERAPARISGESEEFAQALQRANEPGAVPVSAGQSSASAASSHQNTSVNAGSNGSGQPPPGEPERPEQEPSNRPPGDSKPTSDRAAEENEENSSAATGGRGRSSGSRTSSADKQTDDDKANREEPDDEVYDDVEEEEDEEQEAAGAARPLLNQRKAPVDRSLTPSGAGEAREDPDVNGRGGPGGLKKTRGVAAMLLGVPMPDQLLGQANPGRMKVQRERIEPEERFSDERPAADRGVMDETTGSIAHPEMLPWMRDLVRDYFLAERKRTSETSEPQP